MEKNITSPLLSIATLCAVIFPITLLAYEAPPIADTKPPTFITEKSAQLNGQGNPNQMADAVGWFEWGFSGTGTVYETPHRPLPGRTGNKVANTSAKIIGLAPGAQYFYRYIVESGRGRDVGQTIYFTTKPRAIDAGTLVIVETNAQSTVTESSATLRGYVSPHGNTKTEYWFEWGETQRLEAQTPRKRSSAQAGPVEIKITKLNPGTLYFYRIVAENSNGRTYGASRVFTTTGTPPPPPERAVGQQAPSVSVEGDGVRRTTTTSGTVSKSGTKSGSGTTSGITNTGSSFAERYKNIWGSMFKKKSTTTADTTGAVSGREQTASVGASSGVMGTLWGSITGKKLVAVTVEKVGPKKVVAHTPVEYRVTYHYGETDPSENAFLTVTLPETVVYIGDNTANELLVEGGDNGDRMYIFPLGHIAEGSTRTFSILGMTTGDAVGFPDVHATLSYENASGVHVVNDSKESVAKSPTAASRANTAGAASADDGGWLPNSIIEWAVYLATIILAIIGIRKAREYYVTRKEILMKEDEELSPVHLLGQEIPSDLPRGA